MTVLDMRDVRKVYRSGDAEIVALDHATLAVDHGEIVALLGPSGSGKTTLLSIAGGLLAPTEGTVVVDGEDITGHDARRSPRSAGARRVRSVREPVPFLTAEENLGWSSTSQAGWQGSPERFRTLLEELGWPWGKNPPSQFSGASGNAPPSAGPRSTTRPVLLDEPTSVGHPAGEQVMELIRREMKARSCVIVTHDTDDALRGPCDAHRTAASRLTCPPDRRPVVSRPSTRRRCCAPVAGRSVLLVQGVRRAAAPAGAPVGAGGAVMAMLMNSSAFTALSSCSTWPPGCRRRPAMRLQREQAATGAEHAHQLAAMFVIPAGRWRSR